MLKPFFQRELIEAGCDEAGRGCFAGPVFAAAVILPSNFFHPELNDSKLMKPVQREMLKGYIKEHAICYAVAMVDNNEIDAINILQASFKAMHLALDKLKKRPKLILVDGNRFRPYRTTKHHCIIKGDAQYASIAAASVLAKTARDAYMKKLHKEFPAYNWISNKGYGTSEHRTAIETHGLTSYHRKSFNILSAQPSLFQDADFIEDDVPC